MKKFLNLLLVITLFASPASAMDKAKVKMGPVKGKTINVVAAAQGEFINSTFTINSGRNSGFLSVFFPTDFNPSKGDTFNLFSLVGEKSIDNPGELAITFTGTKIKPKGLSVSTTSYTEAADSVVNGKLKVKSFNPDTGVLKFNLKASVSPYTRNKNAGGNETINKNFKIKAQGVVTLAQ